MPTTIGQPVYRVYGDDWRHPFNNPWAREAIAHRGYDDLQAPESEVDDEPPPAPAGGARSRRTADAARAAVADALGVDVSELDDLDIGELADVASNDAADPRAALDALDRALLDARRPEAPKAPRGESDGAYVAREGNWRERHNLPRRRKSVPPSRTPEGRRQAHLRKLVEAGKFTSIAEADANTQRRQSFGRKRR